MDEFNLREVLLKGEDSTRQFKRQINGQDHLAKEIVAFLNTRGGRIFVGVEDDGSISGITPEASLSLANTISNACTQSINPPCSVLTFNVPTTEGMVVVIEVPDGADKPYQDLEKQFWVKKGADKRRVTERTELRRMFQGGHVTYADASPVPGTSLEDLDLAAIRSFYEERFPAEQLSDDAAEMVRQLQGIRLMVGDRLGIAGVLLFAKTPSVLLPEFTIKAVWFKGTDRGGNEYHDSRRFEGTLQSQYEQGMAFFSRWNGRVQEGSFNAPGRMEVPPFVFEEVLVNALVHRDYFIADSIKLFIFDDRIEVRSPGTLPNSLTEEEALRGIGRDRNPLLLSLAYQLMNYRGSRSGLKRVRAAIPDVQLQNDIEAAEVTITIPIN
ncbi:MAG: RNA-binding domain-containing protein [Puniceicoccaceae bacterium]